MLGRIVSHGFHGGIEGVASADLMRMRGRGHPGVDQGVKTLDAELRAWEAHHLLCRGIGRKKRHCGEILQLHVESEMSKNEHEMRKNLKQRGRTDAYKCCIYHLSVGWTELHYLHRIGPIQTLGPSFEWGELFLEAVIRRYTRFTIGWLQIRVISL